MNIISNQIIFLFPFLVHCEHTPVNVRLGCSHTTTCKILEELFNGSLTGVSSNNL